ncbi:MAG: hypothetical protein WC004_03295 [Candidatus Absconditabacterales bacterium]
MKHTFWVLGGLFVLGGLLFAMFSGIDEVSSTPYVYADGGTGGTGGTGGQGGEGSGTLSSGCDSMSGYNGSGTLGSGYSTGCYIDLSLDKEFLGTGASGTGASGTDLLYYYRIKVTNNGTLNATNFTVKDYMPLYSSVHYGDGASIAGLVATWSVSSLSPGQSVYYNLVLIKLREFTFGNKAEVCDYEDGDSSGVDPDSDPCNMGAAGNPTQDDEDLVSE